MNFGTTCRDGVKYCGVMHSYLVWLVFGVFLHVHVFVQKTFCDLLKSCTVQYIVIVYMCVYSKACVNSTNKNMITEL